MNNIQKSNHWKVYDFRDFNLENLVNFRSENKLSDGLMIKQMNLTSVFMHK